MHVLTLDVALKSTISIIWDFSFINLGLVLITFWRLFSTVLQGPTIKSEIERVKSAGGWVEDGRVCGLLAVSRAFGDWELKREGLQFFLDESVE